MRFIDDGVSGARADRRGLRELMAAAKRKAFDVLVVYRSDRLFRSLKELVATIDDLGELGIGFVSVTEPFDTTTSSGRLLLQVCGAFAEFERNVLRERTRSGLAAARARGSKLGRPKRAIDLELVQRLRAGGMSVAAIARELELGPATVWRALSKTSSADAGVSH